MNEESVKDPVIVNPEDYGIYVDKLDNSGELNHMFKVLPENSIVDFNNGIYNAKNKIVINKSMTIKNGTFNFDYSDFSDANGLLFEGGGLEALSDFTNALTNDLLETQSSIIFKDKNHGLVAGDIFCIYNSTAGSFNARKDAYHQGEWCQVIALDGAKVYLKTPLYDTYSKKEVGLFKLNSIKPQIENFTFHGHSNQSLIKMKYCHDVSVHSVNGNFSGNAFMSLNKCVNGYLKNLEFSNKGRGTDDYGLVFGNCQNMLVEEGNIYSRRHAVAMGGDNEIGSVPTRGIKVRKMILRNSPEAGVHCADFHGNCEYCFYEECDIRGGGTYQGKNNGYHHCKIMSAGKNRGVLFQANDVLGGHFTVLGCELIANADPHKFGRGLIDFGGNSVDVSESMTSDLFIDIQGNTLSSDALGPHTKFVTFRNRGSTGKKIRIKIDGLVLSVNNLRRLLWMDVVSGDALVDKVEIANIKTDLVELQLADLRNGYELARIRRPNDIQKLNKK